MIPFQTHTWTPVIITRQCGNSSKDEERRPYSCWQNWLLLTMSPPTTWNQGLLAWKGLCLFQSSLLPSKCVPYPIKGAPLAASSPEPPLGTVWDQQDWLVHTQPHKDTYRGTKRYKEPIPYARKCSLRRCSCGFKLGLKQALTHSMWKSLG